MPGVRETPILPVVLLVLSSCRAPAPGTTAQEPHAGAVEPVQVVRTLAVVFSEHWNRHSDFGADGWHLESRVSVDLFEGGHAHVLDEGERTDSHLDEKWGYKEERTSWTISWAGSWSEDGPGMVLDLEPTGVECAIEKEDYGGEQSKLPCPALAGKVRLECAGGEIPVGQDFLTPEQDRQPTAVWICYPDSPDVEMGGSPVSWVFGRGACLAITSGPGGARVYAFCEEG